MPVIVKYARGRARRRDAGYVHTTSGTLQDRIASRRGGGMSIVETVSSWWMEMDNRSGVLPFIPDGML